MAVARWKALGPQFKALVLDTVATVEIEGDRIAGVYLVRNPDKARAAAAQRVAGR